MVFASLWSRRLDQTIAAYERKAETASAPAARASFFNLAAETARDAGREPLALELEGRAIDAWVRADRIDAAAALCRKIVRRSPTVVRTWCTLAWLDIGRGHFSDVRMHVDHYVDAADRAGRDRLALVQVRRMSALSHNDDLRLHLGERLLWLGDDSSADHVFGLVFEERNGLRRPTTDDPTLRMLEARRAVLQPARAA
ncbi:MAG: hypothetical protein WEB88_16420 [Gemmatimonadota bacterium]